MEGVKHLEMKIFALFAYVTEISKYLGKGTREAHGYYSPISRRS